MIIFGDCRESMGQMITDDIKVQMCVTSPPYYMLRDYGVDGQIGLEKTPEDYIKNMVEVFRMVKDLLADDGTLWLNIGDSYNGSGKGGDFGNSPKQRSNKGANIDRPTKIKNLKPKDLIGIPWMMAFALRADGWYLRQDIIWSKPNPMPESVQDRCTKSHEYLFLLSKSPKYYFDNDAISEKSKTGDCGSSFTKGKTGVKNLTAVGQGERIDDGMRNKRSIWTVPTKPYSGAHFATFPPALIEPCILAGSRKGDTVFDPFMGSGTTAEVAVLNDRQYLGCELNKGYKDLQNLRINNAIKIKSQIEIFE